MPPFSSRFADKVAQVAQMFLQHRCSIVSYVAILDVDDEPVIDDEGHPTYSTLTLINQPCLFLWADSNTTDEQGTVLSRIPTLYVEASSTITEGDLVQNVVARNNTTVLLVSAKVNTIDPTSEGGNLSLKACVLEGAVV